MSRGCQRVVLVRLVLFGVLLLGGCTAARQPAMLAPLPDAAVLLGRLDQYAARFAAVQGVAKTRIVTADKDLSFRQVVLLQKPELLRCEVLSPFGTPLLSLASDGEDLTVSLPGERRFLRGPATTANVARFTQLPLRPGDLVGILLWAPPRFPWQESTVRRDGDYDLLALIGEGKVVQEYAFDRTGRLVRAAYLVDSSARMEIEYREHDSAHNDFPRRIELSFPPRALSASLTLSELDGLTPLPHQRFTLTPPAGVEVSPLP